MQQALYLAKEMGKGMGRSQILQRTMFQNKNREVKNKEQGIGERSRFVALSLVALWLFILSTI